MKLTDINVRDPFVLEDNGTYYLYGTRAKDFGCKVGGFDVYTSVDLENWDGPTECFNSEENGMNRGVNWAPEVYKYRGAYYMFATFSRENGLRGVFSLKADNPKGPFHVHSQKSVSPEAWECIDGTLYVDKNGEPYLVFCHEHTQIIDGTICYWKLHENLEGGFGNPVELFSASSPDWVRFKWKKRHYITDGPFMYRTSNGRLLMIWSTFIRKKYAVAVARSDNDEINGHFTQLPPLFTKDGGHGMVFRAGDRLMLTYHSPNKTYFERPIFHELIDTGDSIEIVKHS